MREAQSTAEIEYAVMLAVLNFHTEFMKSNFSHVQVQMLDDVIDVVLTRSAPIPAEELLAQSAEGEALLREVHGAIFRSCQEALKAQIERVVGRGVKLMAAAVDPRAGRAGLTITLQATAETPPIPQMARL